MEQTVEAVGAHLLEDFEYLLSRPESAYQRSVLRRSPYHPQVATFSIANQSSTIQKQV